MNKIETYLLQSSNSLLGDKTATKEWKIAIIIISIVLLLTCFISIYSSFEFFQEIIQPLAPNFAINLILTFLLLILIESLTQLGLVKFWRFLFKGNNITATIALFIISASLYALSWYTSCNGMAIKEGKKVDNTVVISSNYSDKLQKIENDKNDQIKELTSTIKAIKNNPEGWGGGVRKATILSASQRKEINSLYNRIETIKKQATEAKNELKLNNSIQIDSNIDKVESTQSKYYNIVAIIMLVQIICNAAIMFIYRTIGQENEEISTSIQKSAKALRDECKKMAVSMVQTDMQQTFAEITKAYDNGKPSTSTPPANNTEDQKKKVTTQTIETNWEFLN